MFVTPNAAEVYVLYFLAKQDSASIYREQINARGSINKHTAPILLQSRAFESVV